MMRLLVFATDPRVAPIVRSCFDDGTVRETSFPGEVAELNAERHFDFAFADLDLLLGLGAPGNHGSCLKAFQKLAPGARVVVLTPTERIHDAVDFVREGAGDYLSYPVTADELELVRFSLDRYERFRAELKYLRGRVWESESLESVSSRSEAMRAVMYKVKQVASTRSTVLLTGETGTGKSHLAKSIHRVSSRAERQMVSLHCGAIPDGLLESELFGHERGAFTGADRRKLGRFEIADGGTLFLDEIATISPAMQVKLLHVLQERTFQRVGGESDISVDVRIVAATNMDLARLVAEGLFRNDLFYRLNVFPIELPPLRTRRDDIPLLAEAFVERCAAEHGKEITNIHPVVMAAFMSYAWPGNVRELENLIERAVILESSRTLTPEDFPDEIYDDQIVGRIAVDTAETLATARARAVEQTERLYLKEQLANHAGHIGATAAAAGVTPRQLHKLMTRHTLKKEDFK